MSSVPNSDSTHSTLARSGSTTALDAMEVRIGKRELRRRLWHMSPGFLPLILWPIEHNDPISPLLKYIILTVALVVSGRIFLQFREVRRHASEKRSGAILGYLLAVVGTLLLFPAQAELAFLVLAVLAFGDGSATFSGVLFGGPSLPWNEKKTIVGTIAFVVCGTLMGTVIYQGESNPAVTLTAAFQIAAFTALMAAIAESLPTRIDDNIRVGLTAAITAPLAHAWVIGF